MLDSTEPQRFDSTGRYSRAVGNKLKQKTVKSPIECSAHYGIDSNVVLNEKEVRSI